MDKKIIGTGQGNLKEEVEAMKKALIKKNLISDAEIKAELKK